MTNRGKVIYGESGLLYIKSYLESISLEQNKYRDIFTLIEGSLSRLVLLSAHLCSNCSHKFGRIWKEVQDDLEDAHILFVNSQNSSQKPPIVSEIRENDFQLKPNFILNGEEYPNFNKSDVNRYKSTSRDTHNIFDAKFGEKDFKGTHSNNGSVRSGVYNDAQSQGSISSSYRAGTLTPVKQPCNNVTPPIIDIASPPPPSPFLGSPTLRAMSYPGSGHSSSILSPYGSLGNNFELKNFENEEADAPFKSPLPGPESNEIPLGILATPEHHGPFKDDPATTRSVVSDLIASQCVSRGGHSIVPASVLDIVFAAHQGTTTSRRSLHPDDDGGISPLLNACAAMASSSSEGDQSSENSLESYLHGTEENGSAASRRTPLDPSELPNDSSDRDDSFCDLLDTSPPPLQTQSVGVGWEAAAVYGLAPSPSANSDTTDDIFIEKEIIYGKIARRDNPLEIPVYDLDTSMIKEVYPRVNRQASRSPVFKTSSPKPEQQDTCSSNIFETMEKFNERRRVQSLNQEPALEEEEDDADSDYEPRPSRHKAADKNNGKPGRQVGRNKRKRKPAALSRSTTATTAPTKKKKAKR